MKIKILTGTIAMIVLTINCKSQAVPGMTLLVLSKTDHTLAIIDPATMKSIARVPVGTDPHEVIASADGNTAYVSIYGGGSLHELDVIDLISQKPLPAIDTRPLFGPHGLDFAQGKVWFSAEGSKSVGRYDPAIKMMDWSMGTGQNRTHMVYVTPDGKNVYTTNVSSGTVSILTDSLVQPPVGPNGQTFPGAQPRQEWFQTVIPVTRGSEGFDVTPDGKELWTAASDNGSIAVIDIAARKVSTTIDIKAVGANRLKFTPDGKLAMVSTLRSGEIYVVDVATRKLVKKINVGHGAAGILMYPDGSRALVACTPDNYVAVIDLKTLSVIGQVDAGGGPDGMAWAIRR